MPFFFKSRHPRDFKPINHIPKGKIVRGERILVLSYAWKCIFSFFKFIIPARIIPLFVKFVVPAAATLLFLLQWWLWFYGKPAKRKMPYPPALRVQVECPTVLPYMEE